MAKKPLPSPEVLRQLLRYEPDTGKLFWRERGPGWFDQGLRHTPGQKMRQWNSRYAGTEAFTSKDAHGYLVGAIFNVKYKSHRVAWAMVSGEWPTGDVDHINCDRSDNRLSNLRLATRAQNMQNRGATRRNTTGLKGVCWDSGRKKWLAQIKINGRNTYLGRHDTPEQAHAAYLRAADLEHGEFARS